MDRLDHDPDADSLPDNIRFASNSIDNDTREDPEPAPAPVEPGLGPPAAS